jgi:hypothetical protein
VLKIELEIKGREEMQRAMLALGAKGREAMGSALWNEANRIMNKSKEIVPVKESYLKDSGHVVPLPEYTIDGVIVTMGYGGEASDYAEVQHEELSYQHKSPTQAKYLEQPLLDAAQDMGFRIAKDLWDKLK